MGTQFSVKYPSPRDLERVAEIEAGFRCNEEAGFVSADGRTVCRHCGAPGITVDVRVVRGHFFGEVAAMVKTLECTQGRNANCKSYGWPKEALLG